MLGRGSDGAIRGELSLGEGAPAAFKLTFGASDHNGAASWAVVRAIGRIGLKDYLARVELIPLLRLVFEEELEEVRGGTYRQFFRRNNWLTLS